MSPSVLEVDPPRHHVATRHPCDQPGTQRAGHRTENPGQASHPSVNDAENTGWLRRNDVIDVLDRNPRHPSDKPLRYVVGLDRTRSGYEDEFLAFCATYGLPTPTMNAKVAGLEADRLHRIVRQRRP
jgi:hypothetical protein